jgi:hypothetical protein
MNKVREYSSPLIEELINETTPEELEKINNEMEAMNDKQQTAVDSILAKLNNVKPTEFCSIETIKKWCEQAKEMEKEQIMNAFDECGNWQDNYTDSEHYYNETYGGNK